MNSSSIMIRSRYGEVITCRVKYIVKHSSGAVTYVMDYDVCNVLHNSRFNRSVLDCIVFRLYATPEGCCEVYGFTVRCTEERIKCLGVERLLDVVVLNFKWGMVV
jgi:hypothetical protein